MSVYGINDLMLLRKAGGIPRVSTRFSLSVENEYVCWQKMGRPDQPRETKFPGGSTNGNMEKNNFLCSANHEQDWHPYPNDSYSAI